MTTFFDRMAQRAVGSETRWQMRPRVVFEPAPPGAGGAGGVLDDPWRDRRIPHLGTTGGLRGADAGEDARLAGTWAAQTWAASTWAEETWAEATEAAEPGAVETGPAEIPDLVTRVTPSGSDDGDEHPGRTGRDGRSSQPAEPDELPVRDAAPRRRSAGPVTRAGRGRPGGAPAAVERAAAERAAVERAAASPTAEAVRATNVSSEPLAGEASSPRRGVRAGPAHGARAPGRVAAAPQQTVALPDTATLMRDHVVPALRARGLLTPDEAVDIGADGERRPTRPSTTTVVAGTVRMPPGFAARQAGHDATVLGRDGSSGAQDATGGGPRRPGGHPTPAPRPEIHVHIDRIDLVRAAPAPPVEPRPSAGPPAPDRLAAFLEQRRADR